MPITISTSTAHHVRAPKTISLLTVMSPEPGLAVKIIEWLASSASLKKGYLGHFVLQDLAAPLFKELLFYALVISILLQNNA